MNKIRILLLSDTHGNVEAIDKIIKNIKHDYSIITGDFVCDDSIINKNFTHAVRGNNDFYSSYPDYLDFEISGIKFHIEHGHLSGTYSQLDDYDFMHKKLLEYKCSVLVHGHTHIPKIFKYKEGIVINPGSTTLPRGGSNPSYGIIEIDSKNNLSCKLFDYKKEQF